MKNPPPEPFGNHVEVITARMHGWKSVPINPVSVEKIESLIQSRFAIDWISMEVLLENPDDEIFITGLTAVDGKEPTIYERYRQLAKKISNT